MSIPTNEPKTKVLKVRISNELEERIKTKGDNLSETIRNLIEAGLKETDKGSFVPQNNDFVPRKQYEALKEKFNTLSTRVRPEAKDYWKNEIYTGIRIVPAGFVKQNDDLENIKSMVKYQHGSIEDFLSDLNFKLTWDQLKLKDGKIDLESTEVDQEMEKELSDLKNACEEKGISMVEAIKKTKQSVYGVRQ